MTPSASPPPVAAPPKQRPEHRRGLRPGARLPRRVSGPMGGRAAGAGAAPRPAPGAPPRPAPGAAHQLLDRLVRARAWIPVLGVLLAGIVAMQVEVLKLGAGIGRSVQTATELQSRNELLRASVAGLSDEQRIEQIATKMGMVIPPPGGVAVLPAQRTPDVGQALANVHAPNASAFESLQTTNGVVVGVDPSGAGTAVGADAAAADPASAGTDAAAASDTSAAGAGSGAATVVTGVAASAGAGSQGDGSPAGG
ncbi:MAG: hypothetical protein ABSG43_03075 [Solirubrobacteraceae bacterium]